MQKNTFKFTLVNSIIRKLDFDKFQRQKSLPGTWIPLRKSKAFSIVLWNKILGQLKLRI